MEKEELVEALISAGALKFGKFVLSSGRESNYYVDLRIIPSFPDLFSEVIEAYVSMISPYDFDRIAGIETAGIPIATGVSLKTKIPMIYVRKEAKKHGTGKVVEGVVHEGDEVALVDDVITTGASKVRAINALRALGVKVEHVFVLVDREEGGRERLKQEGCELHAYLKASDLIEKWEEFL